MCNPEPQDYHGEIREDDAGIGPADRLLRHCRVPAQILQKKNDTGDVISERISDQAFKTRRGDAGVSIEIECLILAKGQSWEDRYGLMRNTKAMLSVTAAQARELSNGVAWTPKPAEPNLEGFAANENPFHGEIILPMTNAQIRDLTARAVVLRNDIQ